MDISDTKIHTINIDQGYLLTQVSNSIKHALLRRLKRSDSLGFPENSIRNLKRFYVLVKEFLKIIKKL